MNIRRFPAWIAPALAIIPCARGAQPWDEPFSKDTRAIAAAAQQIKRPDNPGVIILLDEYRYLIHADGRTDLTHRKVYRVTQQDAVEEWSSAEQGYQPWYQKKPEIRARVVGPGGDTHSLDVKTVADSPAGDVDATIFSDARVVRAPLPSVSAGSVVEYEIAIQDTAPLLDAGVTQRISVDAFVPVERFHAVVDAEAGVPLRFVARLIPDSATRRADGKGAHVECDFGPFEPPKHFEGNLPPNVPNSSYVAFSTGKSWQSVAARYSAIVDQKLQATDWKSFLEGVELKGEPRAVAARLTAKLHAGVRYTGVEFGDAAIVPGAPTETIGRGYGDCKDKSTLLVAMLRAAGLKADVALLLSGYGTDVEPDLPGMGVFNNAIVYVASDPPLWIDATATDTRVGFMPSVDQGRLALIANGESTGLTKVPEAVSSNVIRRDSIEITMSDFGSGTARETIEVSGGSSEATFRSMYGAAGNKLKERLEPLVKQGFGAKAVGAYEVTPHDDWTRPFRMTVEALQVKVAITGPDDAGVALSPVGLLAGLPYDFWPKFAQSQGDLAGDAQEEKRQHDFLIPEPYVAELRYKIIPPALFQVTNLPAAEDVKIGTTTYSRSFHSNPDGSIEAVYILNVGKRRLTPEEYEALRDGLKKHLNQPVDLIAFSPTTAEYLAVGQAGKALALIREAVGREPQSATAHVRLARLLVSAHLGGAARAEAVNATELDAKSAAAWETLGWTYEHDTFGRRMQGDWDYAQAEKCYRKALELDPEDPSVRSTLASLLEYDSEGLHYAKDAQPGEAVTLLREILKKQANPAAQHNLVLDLLYSGELDAAREEVKKASQELQAVLQPVFLAIDDSPARAILKVQAAFPDSGQTASKLDAVGTILMQLRHYPEATVVAGAAARLTNDSAIQGRAELWGMLKKWDQVMLKDDDPRRPVQRLFLEILRNNLTSTVLKSIISKDADPASWEQNIEAVRASLFEARRVLASGQGLNGDALLDFVFSLLDMEKDGDENHGFRIVPHSTGTGPLPTMYVVPQDGRYRLSDVAGLSGNRAIADHVLALLAKNDIKGAQWWLDKVTQFTEIRVDGSGPTISAVVWDRYAAEKRGPAAIRLAATSLIATSTGDEKAIQTLELARQKLESANDKRIYDEVLCSALLRAKKWTALMEAARRLENSQFNYNEGFRYFIAGAEGAGKWAELETEGKARFAADPRSSPTARAVALALARQGNWAGAAEWARKSSEPNASADAALALAWSSMMAGKPDESPLADLKKATFGHNYRYTMAMLQASLQKPDDAMQTLIGAVGSQDFRRLHPAVWLAYSRICERYGYPAEASGALERARGGQFGDDELSAWVRATLQLPSGAPAPK